MWIRGVDRALGAWGTHVALLISPHGGVIYRRFTTWHRIDEFDAAAARGYLEAQAPREAAWAKALHLRGGGFRAKWRFTDELSFRRWTAPFMLAQLGFGHACLPAKAAFELSQRYAVGPRLTCQIRRAAWKE